MEITYYSIFQYDSDGICISFPDIPTCVTCADSYEEGIVMAKDVLGLVLHGTAISELPAFSANKRPRLLINQKAVAISIEMRCQDGILYCDDVIELT